MQIFDDDDYMVSSPKDNFFSIIETANKNIVQMELEKVIEKLAIAEKLLEENDLESQFEREIKTYAVENPEDFENRKNSIFIETVGNIVTQCE